MTAAWKSLAAALVLVAGAAAQAESLDIEYVRTDGIVLTTSHTTDYLTGGLQYLRDGSSFEAFCVEAAQGHAAVVASAQRYSTAAFAGAEAALLQGLFSSSYADLGTPGQKAAFQTAIWEITHETSGTVDADAGSFQFFWLSLDSPAQQDAAFLNLTASYLQAAAGYAGPARYALTRLHNDSYQDLVTVSPVPEPESYALLLAGLGVIGFVAGRRRPR
jgi:hypothetical protein